MYKEIGDIIICKKECMRKIIEMPVLVGVMSHVENVVKYYHCTKGTQKKVCIQKLELNIAQWL